MAVRRREARPAAGARDAEDAGRRRAEPRSGPATLHDVARHARVSPMTVSNVVRGKHGAVSAATRARVERAIGELGYRPHATARNLRLARRFSVGMIVVDESPRFLADPFITELVAGLGNHLRERGYELVLQGLRASHLAGSRLVQNIQTDGLCVLLSGAPPVRERALAVLASLHQPTVLFQQAVDEGHTDVCTVRQDDRAGGAMLARLLIEAGARSLLSVLPALQWPAITERVAGMLEVTRACAGARLATLPTGDDFEEVQRVLGAHLAQQPAPDAILAGNDQIGIAVVKSLAARGLGVPRDVRVTGFNAFEFRHYPELELTTVRSPAYELGERGGAELLWRLESGSFRRRDIVLPVELQIGGST